MPIARDISSSAEVVPARPSEHGPGVTVPPTVAFAAGFLLAWGVHQRIAIPIYSRGLAGMVVIGWVLFALGVALFLWALRVFFLARTGIMLQKPATNLMMAGPYAWSRNPQYIAFIAMYCGIALVMNTLWPVVLLLPVLAVVATTVIKREERYLRETFGAAYEAYCERVGRWL
jgi:protein-S-isoprenylcysteine O-methyltransferase Ste14